MVQLEHLYMLMNLMKKTIKGIEMLIREEFLDFKMMNFNL